MRQAMMKTDTIDAIPIAEKTIVFWAKLARAHQLAGIVFPTSTLVMLK